MTDNQPANDDDGVATRPARADVPVKESVPIEPRADRLRRHGHRARLYTRAFALVALLVVLIALSLANTRQVKLNWLVGTSHASLVWIILASAVLGWLLGILTGVIFRVRTRRRHSPPGATSAKTTDQSSMPIPRPEADVGSDERGAGSS